MSALRTTALATGVVYLTWRLAFTSDGANPVMFFLLLGAEAFGLLRLQMETSLLGDIRPDNRTPEKTIAPDADVIVVVTDEPASEVRAAVLSARLIQGYTNLRIVDRDDRPDVADLASRLGLLRVVGGFEADPGGLTDKAVEQCTSLYALIMPADVVVMPDILEVSAGAFDDSEVGVIGVSPFGLDVVSSKPMKVGDTVRIAFELPQVDGSSVRFDCPTAVRRSSRDGKHHVAYLRFAQMSDAEVDRITEHCSLVAGHHAPRDIAADEAPVAPLAEVVVHPRA